MINWKKTGIILADILIGVYLVLAISAFNNPDDPNATCTKVNVNIADSDVKGFLNEDFVKLQLQRSKLYPVGDLMSQVNVRAIEESLQKSPLVDSVECYKSQSGHVNIEIAQRLPVMRIMADNGEDYYLDHLGAVMPASQYASDLVVATGHISKQYAQKVLTRVGNLILGDAFWRNQIEQLHILQDGSVEMVPRVGDHIVYLGSPTGLSRKLERLEKFYKYGLSQAGWNKYERISVEFDNQIICKKR